MQTRPSTEANTPRKTVDLLCPSVMRRMGAAAVSGRPAAQQQRLRSCILCVGFSALILVDARRAARQSTESTVQVEAENLAPAGSSTRAFTATVLTQAECETVKRLARFKGIPTDATVSVGGAAGSSGSAKPAPEQRSTDLRWLPETAETSWLYRRMLKTAKLVNREAGWSYESLSFVSTMQVGAYDANAHPPGHLHWHADQEWVQPPARGAANKIRIISISTQLSDEKEYTDGQLRIGLLNASRIQGDALGEYNDLYVQQPA